MTETKPRPPRSEAAREASRRNGANSRGPKTAAGKAISARNALKHGLRARKTLAPDNMPAWVVKIEATFERALAPLGVRNREGLERLLHSLILIAEVERLMAAEMGRMDLFQREQSEPASLADLEVLSKLINYRKRFYGTRNQCFLKIRAF